MYRGAYAVLAMGKIMPVGMLSRAAALQGDPGRLRPIPPLLVRLLATPEHSYGRALPQILLEFRVVYQMGRPLRCICPDGGIGSMSI